jgi:hypothetical protein
MPVRTGVGAPPRRRLPRGPNRRKGVYTLWTILFLPALVLGFILVVDGAQLWLARVELENSLEAAALAAVKEWGDANGGSTLVPRLIGVEYAAANTINGLPVAISTNYNPNNPPNQNDSCAGNLVFGAVSQEAGTPCPRYIFNAGIQPSCGAGRALIDASGQGNLQTGNNYEWGIAFQRDELTPPNLLIASVVIDLGLGNDAYFDVQSGLGLADAVSPNAVNDGGTLDQPDISGFPAPTTQIQWTYSGLAYGGTRAKILTFTFYPDPVSGDPGFQPCDRFRFGQMVVKEDTNGQFDGDDMGRLGVRVTVVFSLGGILLPPVTGTFFDNQDVGRECSFQGYDPFCGSMIVSPSGIPDLPCPPGDAPKNNGQSYVLLPGGGMRNFGVRAQATVSVNSLLCRLCGNLFGPFDINACTTAMYDCTERRPRLIRVERQDFICPGP